MEQLGGYRITGTLGQGGMATVYKAIQVSLDRPVAIKVLARTLSGNREVLERFQRESVLIARLNHPNIIHVIDRGVTSQGMPYFVMEYVEGTDLARASREGRLEFNRKLDLCVQVCKALAYAHKNGVVHRDIKPANVVIDTDGNARVLDFGIAQLLNGDGGPPRHTAVGTVMGTVAYMSPEQQLDAHRVTAASDLYSLGVLMYELYTGQRPLGRFAPPAELNPGVPPALNDLVLECLAPDPEQRPGSADEVKDRLLKLLRGAHLEDSQRRRAGQGIARIEEKFALLDVIKEDRYGAAYLYENRVDRSLLVIKRRAAASSGFKESKLLATLKHPHVAKVLGVSGNERMFIVVTEYLSGGSLRERMARRFSCRNALEILRQVCEGLAFAHRNRVVHGNLRPSNVLFSDAGTVKITDFGLDEHYASQPGVYNWYGVPGEHRSPAVDVFAVGVIAYQLLTGALPVWDRSRLVESDGFHQLDPSLRELLGAMLARDPAARLQNFDRVMDRLDQILTEGESRASSEAATVCATASGDPENPSPPPAIPVRALALLGVLAVTAGFYLAQIGAIDFYGDALAGVWERVASPLRALLHR